MRTFFRINNILLIVAMIGCCAGALAGLIVLLPFVAGAWALNLVGLLGFEEAARTENPRTPTEAGSQAKQDARGGGWRAKLPADYSRATAGRTSIR